MEIKFKGKRVDNGEWVYGSLLQAPTDDLNHTYISLDVYAHYDERVGYYGDNSMRVLSRYFPVIPETVGQYIGVPDKNKQDVYERDICDTHTRFGKGVVIFESGIYKINGISLCSFRDIEVIGNIYDNPELL